MQKRQPIHERQYPDSNFARNCMAYHDWADKWQLHHMGQRQDRDLFHVEHRAGWLESIWDRAKCWYAAQWDAEL